MIVSMSCPTCGEKASEYDTNKWCCLVCGKKFLYAPPSPPPATVINTHVSIQGSGLFDLEAGDACPPVPIFEKKWRHTPEYFAPISSNNLTIAELKRSLPKLWTRILFYGVISAVLLMVALLFLIGAVISIFNRTGSFLGCLVVAVIFGVLFAVFFLMCLGSNGARRDAQARTIALANRNRTLEAEEDDDVVAGHTISCPHCRSPFASITEGCQLPVGLHHCLECGKQFFTAQAYSYRLIQR